MSELKELRERVRLRARADALEMQLDRRKKRWAQREEKLKQQVDDLNRRLEKEHAQRIHAEREANRQRHLYQDMTHIAQQLMRQLDELKAAGAGGAA